MIISDLANPGYGHVLSVLYHNVSKCNNGHIHFCKMFIVLFCFLPIKAQISEMPCHFNPYKCQKICNYSHLKSQQTMLTEALIKEKEEECCGVFSYKKRIVKKVLLFLKNLFERVYPLNLRFK